MKPKGYLYLSLVGAGLVLASCATAPETGGAQGDLGAKSQNGAPQDSAAPGARGPDAALPIFRPDPASADITAMGWGPGQGLQLGYADGKWVQLDWQRHDATLHPGVDGKGSVVSISQNGELIFVGSTPPEIIRLRDRQVVFRLNKVKQMSAGGFFPSGAGFFAAEETGELHVWTRSEKALDEASIRDLKQVAMRQPPDFSVGLPSTVGQWLVTRDDSLIMGVSDGDILSWKLSAPDQVDTVGHLPSPGKSLGVTDDFLVAATLDGALWVSERSRPVYAPWSKGERAEAVAASTKLPGSFAVVEKRADQNGELRVGLRDFLSGEYLWQVHLEPAEICGFELSSDARQLALCVDSALLVFDTTRGALSGAFRRNGDTLEWQPAEVASRD